MIILLVIQSVDTSLTTPLGMFVDCTGGLCVFRLERWQDFFPVEGKNKSCCFLCLLTVSKLSAEERQPVQMHHFYGALSFSFSVVFFPSQTTWDGPHTHTHTAVCMMPFLPLGLWCMQGPVFTKSLDLLAILEQVIGYKCFSPLPFSCQFLSYLPGLSVNSL